MVVSSLEKKITCLNVLPKKNGISKTLIPSAIVIGAQKICTNHATLQPRSYVHCKTKARIKNKTKTSSGAEITLRRSKKRGGNYFMSLNTGCYQFQEFPITDAVIYFVK